MSPPKFLYKYCEASLQTLTNLKDQIVYFSSPLRFNDPYDCAHKLRFLEVTEQHTEIYRRYLLKNERLSMSARQAIAKMTTTELREAIANHGEETILAMREKTNLSSGVACFSARNDSLLMWSHYASKHEGICLKFSTDDDLFAKAKSVVYSDSMPSIDLVRIQVDESYDFVSKLYCTKSIDWKYEEEWRVLHKHAGTKYGYAAKSLTDIYFGVRVNPSLVETICLVMRGQNEFVRYWQGRFADSEFKVEFERFDYTTYLDAKRQGLVS